MISNDKNLLKEKYCQWNLFNGKRERKDNREIFNVENIFKV